MEKKHLLHQIGVVVINMYVHHVLILKEDVNVMNTNDRAFKIAQELSEISDMCHDILNKVENIRNQLR